MSAVDTLWNRQPPAELQEVKRPDRTDRGVVDDSLMGANPPAHA